MVVSVLRRYRVLIVLVALIAVIGVMVGYRLKAQQARAVPRARPDPLVGVVSPARRDLQVRLSSTADILPAQQAALFSKVTGYIRKIHAERGERVKEGQLLVEIDDRELQAQLDQAKAGVLTGQANVLMARSSLAGAHANLENQRANLTKARAVAANDGRQADRMKALFDRGLVSATEWENARTAAESSSASVQSAEAQLAVSQTQVTTADSQVRLADAQLETQRASLQLAQATLANTRLTAPFAGILTQRNLDPGAVVSAGSSGTNTSSVGILLIQDIQTVKVHVDIPERAVDRVTTGQAVRVTVDALKGTVFSGTVARLVHTLDPRSRTMGVEVDIPNRDGRLKPGMFARVELVLDTRKQALVVPGEALRLGEGKPAVMVVREGVAQSVPVETGVVDGPWIEVRTGVTEKDKVIVQGKDLVKSGQKVRAAPATAVGG